MKIQIQWQVVIMLITSTGVALLLLREVVRQWSKWKHSPDDDFYFDCTNGTKKCLLENLLHSRTQSVKNVPAHETVPAKPLKTITEFDRKRFYSKKKRSQGRKPHFPKKTKRHTYMMEVDSWPRALGPDSFDLVDVEDINISEEANLQTEIYIPESSEERSTTTHQNANTMELGLTLQKLTTRKPESVSRPIMPPFPKADSRVAQYEPHPPEPKQLSSNTMSDRLTVDIIISCMVGSFLATTLVLLSVLIAGFTYNYVKVWRRKARPCKRFDAPENPEIVVDSHLKLSMLPPNLEDFLVKQLDVRRSGQRSYGWQKVGEVFNINRDDLRYLKIEYKRDNGSPTSKLLEMLGKTKNKTISDLVRVLNSSESAISSVPSPKPTRVKARR